MKKSLKVVATVTLVCFLTTQTVWGAPGAGIEMAGKMELPAYLSIDIPAEFGTVDSLYEAPAGANPQFILHIQNAHANYQAQMKIKQLLGYMNKKYGFSTIFVEGASEKLDPDYLRLFPDQERNLKLCDELAKQGELTGVELYMMEADKNIAALGIEEASLYKANYDALKKVFGAETDVTRFFKGFDGKLDKAASKVFTPETRALIGDWKRFEQGRRDFMPFVRELAKKSKKILNVDVASLFAQVGWPQISRLLVIQQLEKDLNRAKGQEEQAALIQWLRGKNVSKELIATLESFNEGSIAVGKSTKEVSPREVLERLNAEAGPQGFKFSDYPAFSLFAGYVTLRSELDPKVLFEEIEYLFTQMLDQLAEEPKQKELLALYRDGELLRKLLHLELNRAQWRQAVAGKDRISVPSLVSRLKDAVIASGDESIKRDQEIMPKAFGGKMDELYAAGLEFYDYARMRESVFYKQMQSAMAERKITKAILITGGFHTDGMSDLFRENSISYGIVTPRLSEKSDEGLYRATMLQDREHLFSISYIEMVSKMLNINVLISNGVDAGKLYAGLIDVAAKMDNASIPKTVAEFNKSPLALKNNIVLAMQVNAQGEVLKGADGLPVYKIVNRGDVTRVEVPLQEGQVGGVSGQIIPTVRVASTPTITTTPALATAQATRAEVRTEVIEIQSRDGKERSDPTQALPNAAELIRDLKSGWLFWDGSRLTVRDSVGVDAYQNVLTRWRSESPEPLAPIEIQSRDGKERSDPAQALPDAAELLRELKNGWLFWDGSRLTVRDSVGVAGYQTWLANARSEARETPASREVGHWVSAALAVPALSGLMLAFPAVEKVAVASIPILLGVVVVAVVLDRSRSEAREVFNKKAVDDLKRTTNKGDWVLLIEDHPMMQEAFQKMLLGAGYTENEIEVASSVDEAAKKLAQRVSRKKDGGWPRNIVSDWNLGRGLPLGTDLLQAFVTNGFPVDGYVMMTTDDPTQLQKIINAIRPGIQVKAYDKSNALQPNGILEAVQKGPRSEVRAGMEIVPGWPSLDQAVQQILQNPTAWAFAGGAIGFILGNFLTLAFPKVSNKFMVQAGSTIVGAVIGYAVVPVMNAMNSTRAALSSFEPSALTTAISDPFVVFLLVVAGVIAAVWGAYEAWTRGVFDGVTDWFSDTFGRRAQPAPTTARRQPGIPARPVQPTVERVTEEIETEGIVDITDPRELVVKMDEGRYLVIENPVKGPDVTRSWVSSGSADGSFSTYSDALAAAADVLGLSVDLDSSINGRETAPSVPPLRLALVNNPDKKSYAVAVEIEPVRGAVNSVLVRAVTKSGNLIQELRLDRGNSTTVGRKEGSGIRLLGDTGISRTHLTVNFSRDGIQVRDGDGRTLSSYGVRALPARAEVRAGFGRIQSLAVASIGLITATILVAGMLRFSAWRDAQITKAADALDREVATVLQVSPDAGMEWTPILMNAYYEYLRAKNLADNRESFRGFMSDGTLIEDHIRQLNPDAVEELRRARQERQDRQAEIEEGAARPELRSEVRLEPEKIRTVAAVTSASVITAALIVTAMWRFSVWQDARLAKAADALDRQVSAVLAIAPEEGPGWTPLFMNAYYQYLQNGNLADTHENFTRFQSDAVLVETYIDMLNPDALQELYRARGALQDRLDRVPAPMDYNQITNRNSVLSGQLPAAISLGVALDTNGTPYGVAVNYSTGVEQVTPIPVAPVLDYRVGANGVLYALHLNTETRLPEIARFPQDARDLPVTTGEYRLDRDLGISFETLRSEAPDVAQAWAAVLGRSEARGREPNMLEATGIIAGMMSGFQFVLAVIGNSRESVAQLARPPFDIYRDEWLVGALVTLGVSGLFFLVNYLAGIVKNAFTRKPAPANPQAGVIPAVMDGRDLNMPVTVVPTRLPSQNEILDSLAGLKAEMHGIIASMEDRYAAGVDADDLLGDADAILARIEDRNGDVMDEALRGNNILEVKAFRDRIMAMKPLVTSPAVRRSELRVGNVLFRVDGIPRKIDVELSTGDTAEITLKQGPQPGVTPRGTYTYGVSVRQIDHGTLTLEIGRNAEIENIRVIKGSEDFVQSELADKAFAVIKAQGSFKRGNPALRSEARVTVAERQDIADQVSDLLAPDTKAWLIENRPEFGTDSLANVFTGIVVPSQIPEAVAQDAAKGVADILTAYVTQMRSGTFSFGEFMKNVRDIVAANPAFAVSNERGAVVKVMNQLPSNEELAALGVQLAMNPNLEFNFVIELNDTVEQGMPVFEAAVADIQKMSGANDLKIGNRLAVSYGTAGQLMSKAKNAAGRYKDLGAVMGDHVTLLVEVPEMATKLAGVSLGAVVDVPKINPRNAAGRNFVAGRFSQLYVQSDAEGAMGQLIKSLGDVRAIVKNGRYFDMDDAALSGLAKIWSDIISIAATAKAA